jgi:hypothetical protein
VSAARSSRRQEEGPVRMQTRFERFPASIKGAFVLRGADGNPHGIEFDWARISRVPSGLTRPVAVEERMLHVTPVRDLFVPFEASVSELEPGWYTLESSVKVDAGSSWAFSSRAFAIPWPRGDVRRGSIHVDRRVQVGQLTFQVDRVELAADSASVVWRMIRPAGEDPGREAEEEPAGEALLISDGVSLEVLPPQEGSRLFEPRSAGERRTISYPLLRSARSLAVRIRLGSGGQSDPLKVSLL